MTEQNLLLFVNSKLFKVHIDFLCGGVRPSFKSVITDLKYRGLVRWNANLDLRCNLDTRFPQALQLLELTLAHNSKQLLRIN